MAGFSKIYYKGKEIIYVDYQGQSEDEMLGTASDLRDWLLHERKPHLRLVNITGAFAKPKFNQYIRKLGEETKDIPMKGAIVGVTGGKKALLIIYNKILGGSLKPFDTEEAAKEYLVNQSLN